MTQWDEVLHESAVPNEAGGPMRKQTSRFVSWSNSAKAVTRRCFVKKVFLKVSQDLKENTHVGVSFLIILQNF